MARRPTAIAALALAAAPPAAAEIYRWTDADGRLHFSEDPSRVPADQRPAARAGGAEAKEGGSLQTYEAPAAPRGRTRPVARAGGRRAHRIEVQRAGMGMVVPVRINGRAEAPFLIDTGASYVLLPRTVADELGLGVGPDTRKLLFTTANGVVEQPVVMLDRVELGTASAEQVPASISPSMEVGLLGLSFFNRFTYEIDAAAGVVTLVENDLASNGEILGGRSEAQWRGEFEALRARQALLEARFERTPGTHARRVERLEQEREALERELELLEAEADQARVPDVWRRGGAE